jgi:ubiquinone/menaquinone biosynthesis C-methylase UbiE
MISLYSAAANRVVYQFSRKPLRFKLIKGEVKFMGKTQSNLNFRLMSLSFRFRDFFSPRKNILKEVGITAGSCVLDFGCGPGGYIAPLTNLVGKSGKIYALDTNHLAVKSVRDMMIKKHLTNIETIQSDCKTGLPDNSVDVILLYDTFHDLKHANDVLKELHRVLKGRGILSVNDHHLEENELVTNLTKSGFFKLSGKGKRTHSFLKS